MQIKYIHRAVNKIKMSFYTIYKKFAPKLHDQPLVVCYQSLSMGNISLNPIYLDARHSTESIYTRIVAVDPVCGL